MGQLLNMANFSLILIKSIFTARYGIQLFATLFASLLSMTSAQVISRDMSTRDCGRSNHNAAFYIRGGNEVAPSTWPWVASIRVKAGAGLEHICAGALISDKFVLTAGHCLLDRFARVRQGSELLVVLGSHRLAALHSSPGESVIGVKKVHVHPRYQSSTVRQWAYDLALLELVKPVPLHRRASTRPVCFPLERVPPSEADTCMVVGWGKTEESRFSYVLREARVPLIPRNECNRNDYWAGYVDQTMLCALDEKTGASACQGDSGGPLMCQSSAGSDRWYVHGVVSWGPVMCGDKPGVFTNIAYVSDWLVSTLLEAGERLLVDEATISQNKESGDGRFSGFRLTTPDYVGDLANVKRPCDAAAYNKYDDIIMYGPAPAQFELAGISVKECIAECCSRGIEDCQSFVYFWESRKCRLRKVTSCSAQAHTYPKPEPLPADGRVTFYQGPGVPPERKHLPTGTRRRREVAAALARLRAQVMLNLSAAS